jgi:hypothetical protein
MTNIDPYNRDWRTERAQHAGGFWTIGLVALVVAIIGGALFFAPQDGTRTAQNDSPAVNTQAVPPPAPAPAPVTPRPNG